VATGCTALVLIEKLKKRKTIGCKENLEEGIVKRSFLEQNHFSHALAALLHGSQDLLAVNIITVQTGVFHARVVLLESYE